MKTIDKQARQERVVELLHLALEELREDLKIAIEIEDKEEEKLITNSMEYINSLIIKHESAQHENNP